MATVVSGVILALFMPGLYDDPKPWLLPNLRYFTDRELYILKWRVIIDAPEKAKKSSHISWKQLKSAVSSLMPFAIAARLSASLAALKLAHLPPQCGARRHSRAS